MQRGRPSLPIGQHGSISVTGPKGSKTAFCRFRDADGVTRGVTAKGSNIPAARAALLDKLELRKAQMQPGADITNDTLVSELATRWLASLEDDQVRQSTRDQYRRHVSNHILPALGNLRIREATPARLDGFLKALEKKGKSIPGIIRVVLGLMFDMAVRYEAVPTNYAKATRPPRSAPKSPKALTDAEVAELQADVAAWAATEGEVGQRIVDALELLLATGARTGEILALRFSLFDREARRLRISGTVKYDTIRGLHLQEFTKSGAGMREVVLPPRAVSVLRRRQLAASGDLIFTTGPGGIISPSGFTTKWKLAMGEKWAHVEPRTIRRTVATRIEREHGSLAASLQLGHTSDAVTKAHYIEKNRVVPDFSSTLEYKEAK